jgi:hypothetical protein
LTRTAQGAIAQGGGIVKALIRIVEKRATLQRTTVASEHPGQHGCTVCDRELVINKQPVSLERINSRNQVLFACFVVRAEKGKPGD